MSWKRNTLLLCAVLLPQFVAAQEHRLLVDFELALSFVPQSASVIVLSGDSFALKPAFIVPPVMSEEEPPAGAGKWIFGTRISQPEKGNLRYGLIVFGRGGEVAYAPLQGREARDPVDSFQDAEAMRSYIEQRKNRLNAAMSLEAEQESKLRSLRSDVDLIADIGRIVEVREESLTTEQNLSRLDKDTTDLERSLQQVSSYPPPRNFLRRESELSRQVIELGAAAKQAEDRARKAEAGQTETPAQKRELIESVKDENEQALVQKFGTLRRYRMELEAQQNVYLER